MIEELHKWLELHAHLRDWPKLKNAKAAVEAKIQEIEDRLVPKAPTPEPQITRRAIPSNTEDD